jgi:hypothetical protein
MSEIMTTLLTTPKWIIGKREDLLWLILSASSGFIIILVYYLLTKLFAFNKELCVTAIYLIWAMLFDGTHAFATYTRTYFDKEYYQENKHLLLQSLIVFFVGPLFVLSIFLINTNIDEARAAFIIFNRFGLCFAYYHLIRQHWGFVALYRKKNDETDDITRKLDGLLLMFGSIYPFVHGQHNNIEPMHISEILVISMQSWLNVSSYVGVLGGFLILVSFANQLQSASVNLRVMGYVSLTASVIVNLARYFTLSQLLQYLSILCLIGFIFTVLFYAFILFKKGYFLHHLIRNYPKWLLLFAVLFTYNVIFHMELPLYIIIASVTIFHNIQYHRIIHYHNINKYKEDESERFGFAVVLAQKMLIFVALALSFNLILYVPRLASNFMVTNELLNYTLSSFFWGVAFHHYYLDSVIWKVRNNVQLSSVFKM